MWRKVAVDNLKALVPFKYRVRKIYRQYFPYRSLVFNDEFAFRQGLEILSMARKQVPQARRVMELGTGWVPTIPMLFKAAGFKDIILTDIEPLMDEETMGAARSFLTDRVDRVSDCLSMTGTEILHNLNSSDEVFSYICPFDPASFPSSSVDLVYSRTVLEHISEQDLRIVLDALRTILAPGGISIHIIDNSDHFEHHNKSLSRLNFLQYGELLWWMACFNKQNYQNRLRHSDYVRMFDQSGYDVVRCSGEADEIALNDLRSLSLNKRFRDYDPRDLSILTSTLIVKSR